MNCFNFLLLFSIIHVNALLIIKRDQSHPNIKRIINNVAFEFLSDVETVSSVLNKRSIHSAATWTAPLHLKVDIEDQSFEMEIEENSNLFHSSFQLAKSSNHQGSFQANDPQVNFMTGRVIGYPRSIVRLTLYDNGLLEGSFSLDITQSDKEPCYHFEIAVNEVDEEAENQEERSHDLFKRSIQENSPKVIAYRSDEVEYPEEMEFQGPVHQRQIDTTFPRSVNIDLFRRGSTVTMADNPDCPMAVIADITAYRKHGAHTLTYMLSIMNEVQGMYLNQMNIGLPIVYAHVVTDNNDPSGLGNPPADASSLLDKIAYATGNNLLPNYRNVSSSVCLVHLFTSQDFGGQTGLSFLGERSAKYLGGACVPSYNTGLSTGLYRVNNYPYPLNRVSRVRIVAHEIAHGFGALHDDEYPENYAVKPSLCNVQFNRYLLHSKLSFSKNAGTFSPCSVYKIKKEMMPLLSCLVPRNSVISMASQLYPDQISQPLDQCRELLGPNYEECHVDDDYYDRCALLCGRVGVDELSCMEIPVDDFFIMGKSDGSICGVNYPKPDICWNGKCVADTRVGTCDRSGPCCDVFGNYQRPGSSCKICSTPGNSSSCSNGYICGGDGKLGQCLPKKEAGDLNLFDPCTQVSCPQGSKCVILGKTLFCVGHDDESCKIVCNNDQYTYYHDDKTPWKCDCKSDCKLRNACCSDYDQFCSVPEGLYRRETSASGSGKVLNLEPETDYIKYRRAENGASTDNSISQNPIFIAGIATVALVVTISTIMIIRKAIILRSKDTPLINKERI